MKKAPLIFLTVVLAIVSLHAGQYTIVPGPVNDGYYHDETGRSYDFWDGTTETNAVHYQFWGTSDTVSYDQSYMQFDLSSIPAGTIINSALLNLYITGVHFSDESPTGGFINHSTNGAIATGDASQKLQGNDKIYTFANKEVLGWLQVDVTAAIQYDIDNGYPWAPFHFAPDTTGYFRYSGFSFKSADSQDNKPYLVVTEAAAPPTPIGWEDSEIGWIYTYHDFPWLYSLEHGWEYTTGAEGDGPVYDSTMGIWWSADPAILPWIYIFPSDTAPISGWAWYMGDGRPENRQFQLPDGTIFTFPPAP